MKRIILTAITALMFNVFNTYGFAHEEDETALQLISINALSAGVTEKMYRYRPDDMKPNETVPVHVIEANLNDANTKVKLLLGKNNQMPIKQTVNSMIIGSNTVAAVNGDYFNPKGDGAAIGAQVQDGKMISSPSQLLGMYAFGVTKSKHAFIGQYGYSGTIFAADGESFPVSGKNKVPYWTEPAKTHSHTDTIQLYTSDWNSVQRGNDGVSNPCEAWVEKGSVQKVACTVIQQIPTQDGFILRTSGEAAKWLKLHIHEGDNIQLTEQLVPLQPPDTPPAEEIDTLISGHTLLLKNGQALSFTRDVSSIGGSRARTVVGMNATKDMVYLVVVSGNDNQKGLSMHGLQGLLPHLGLTDAINLDGGSSTQLIVRPLGETATILRNEPEYDRPRAVVNGLSFLNVSPDGTKITLREMPPFQWIGETLKLQQPAYDDYFNPIDTTKNGHWIQSDQFLSKLTSSEWTPQQSGETFITWRADQPDLLNKGLVLNTIGFDHLTQMRIEVTIDDQVPVKIGNLFEPHLFGVTDTQVEREIPLTLSKWSCEGVTLKSDETGKLIVDQISNQMMSCDFDYDGFSVRWAHPTEQSVSAINWTKSADRKLFAGSWTTPKKKIKTTIKAATIKSPDASKQTVLQLTANASGVSGTWNLQWPKLKSPKGMSFTIPTMVQYSYQNQDKWITKSLSVKEVSELKKGPSEKLEISSIPKKQKQVRVNIGNIIWSGFSPISETAAFKQTLSVGKKVSDMVRLWDGKLFVDFNAIAIDSSVNIFLDAPMKRIRWVWPTHTVDWWIDRNVVIRDGNKEYVKTVPLVWKGSGTSSRPFIAASDLVNVFGYQFDWQKKKNQFILERLQGFGNGG